MRWFLLISLVLPISLQRSIRETTLDGEDGFTETSLEKDITVKEAKDAPTESPTISSHGGRKPRSIIISDLTKRWTNFPIPYYMDTPSNHSHGVNATAIKAGIAQWEEGTCITFQQLDHKPTGHGLCFKYFAPLCTSLYLGRVLPPLCQDISIGKDCHLRIGRVSHEIGHSLGLIHEQNRPDRDDYVTIFHDRMRGGGSSQYAERTSKSVMTFGMGYDYGSVMHYRKTAFQQEKGTVTMVSKDPNYTNTMGQANGPSFIDFKTINFAYCADKCKNTLPCLNEGYTDPKDCSKCRCPDGFGGVLCDQASPSPAACGVNNLIATNEPQTISKRGKEICNYVIKAPEGKQVHFEINDFTFFPPSLNISSICEFNYLEIKYDRDMSRTGARFCRESPEPYHSHSNQLAVLYHGEEADQFTLTYRYDPQDAPTATADPSSESINGNFVNNASSLPPKTILYSEAKETVLNSQE